MNPPRCRVITLDADADILLTLRQVLEDAWVEHKECLERERGSFIAQPVVVRCPAGWGRPDCEAVATLPHSGSSTLRRAA